jgi:hypothetical protein
LARQQRSAAELSHGDGFSLSETPERGWRVEGRRGGQTRIDTCSTPACGNTPAPPRDLYRAADGLMRFGGSAADVLDLPIRTLRFHDSTHLSLCAHTLLDREARRAPRAYPALCVRSPAAQNVGTVLEHARALCAGSLGNIARASSSDFTSCWLPVLARRTALKQLDPTYWYSPAALR